LRACSSRWYLSKLRAPRKRHLAHDLPGESWRSACYWGSSLSVSCGCWCSSWASGSVRPVAVGAVEAVGGQPSTPSAEVRAGHLTGIGRSRSAGTSAASKAWPWAVSALTAGAFVAAIVMAPPAAASPVSGLIWLLFLGSSVHVASTAWLYGLPEVRSYALQRPLRYVWIPLGLVVAGAPTAALLSPAVMAWLLLPYFAWQFFHFQKQNLGMAALAAAAHGVTPLRPVERWALIVAGVAGITGLMAHPGLLQLHIEPHIGALFAPAALTFAGAVGVGLVSLVRRASHDRPAGFSATYLLSLLFSLPIFVFRSRYAAVGGMTIAHGFQYLLLMGLIAAGGARGGARAVRVTLFGTVALVGGAVLSGASHLHGASPALRLLFGAYLGVVMAHFVVDAGFWRMRNAFSRQFIARHVPYLVPLEGPLPTGDRSPADIS